MAQDNPYLQLLQNRTPDEEESPTTQFAKSRPDPFGVGMAQGNGPSFKESVLRPAFRGITQAVTAPENMDTLETHIDNSVAPILGRKPTNAEKAEGFDYAKQIADLQNQSKEAKALRNDYFQKALHAGQEMSVPQLIATALTQIVAPAVGAAVGGVRGAAIGGDKAAAATDQINNIFQQHRENQQKINLAGAQFAESDMKEAQAGLDKMVQLGILDRNSYAKIAKNLSDFAMKQQHEENYNKRTAAMGEGRSAAADARAEAAKGREEGKTEKMAKDLEDFFQKSKAARGGALGIEEKKINMAQHLKALMTDENGNVKDLSQIPMEEASIGVANMVSGGNQAAYQTVARIVPKSAMGSYETIKSYLFNHPEALHQLPFIKQMVDIADRQEKVSSEILKKNYYSGLPRFSEFAKRDPERYQKMLQANYLDPENDLNEKGQYAPGSKKSSPAAAQQTATQKYSAGDQVTLNGKTVTIKKILPDGRFEY